MRILLFFILFVGLAANRWPAPALEIKSDDARLEKKGAILYLDDQAFSGILKEYFSNGKLKSMVMYYAGRRDGVSKKHNEMGRLIELRKFDKGEKDGLHQAWWDNGLPRFEYAFESGKHHGIYKEWDNKGMLAVSKNYQKGQEEGTQQTWYDNGQLKANYVVKNGKRYGSLGFKLCKPIIHETN